MKNEMKVNIMEIMGEIEQLQSRTSDLHRAIKLIENRQTHHDIAIKALVRNENPIPWSDIFTQLNKALKEQGANVYLLFDPLKMTIEVLRTMAYQPAGEGVTVKLLDKSNS